MSVDVHALWAEVMPEVRNAVTGVGVWTALNSCRAVTLEDGQFVIGLPGESGDLAGHLRLGQTRTLMERLLANKLGQTVTVRVIDGIEQSDWELVKRRDVEARRLQDQAVARQKAEIQSRSSWDSVYDQISRKFAEIPNKSLPQNKARFFTEALNLVLEGLKTMPIKDELSERNFARCIERVAQYSEIPSTLVAMMINERQGS
ncbi:MAG: hypothetical protein J0L72_05330 [Armatimonadetes bacterium]|nr:hypothetical protein [Armatimonadota bacterium]